MSVNNIIRQYLYDRYPDIVHGGTLERLAFDEGYKASTFDRACRKLRENNIIENIPNEKGHTRYRYILESDRPLLES